MVPSFSTYLEAKAAIYNEASAKYNFIPVGDPVRRAVAELITKNTNMGWKKPGEALTAIQEVLHEHGYAVAHPSFTGSDKFVDPSGKPVTQNFSLVKIMDKNDPFSETQHMDSSLVFSYYWRVDPMENSNARVEVNAYIS
jgi:hypothetical protein